MAAMLLVAGACLAGCATLPPPAPAPAPPAAPRPAPTGTGPSPSAGTSTGSGAASASARSGAAPAAVDSTPSADAIAVLRTLSEPPGTTTPATTSGTASESSTQASRGAAPDTSESPADSSDVPVPTPTQPLGQQQSSRATATLPDSLAAPPTAASPAPASGAARTAAPDSCWRVQIGARQERTLADRLAEAARSQLLLVVVVEHEGSLFKVRTRDCFSATGADDIRRRAADSGFRGAFRFQRKKH